ncbi:uncharacterized protein LOC110236469, partial [Exaiptasia diaphana]|uniref:Uncharacterized protein n=1 Tax=Exaiptasia diaphana TaxID=2652724 RepID=A0A913YGG8_EXADI
MPTYSDEELNYFRLCKIITSVIPEGLREIFKQQWDTHYTTTHGPWMDTPANFASFQSMESPRNRKKNKRLLGIMKNGDRTNWDSTCLSYAILFSDSVGPRLQPNVKNSVNILRESRNEVAHNTKGRLKDADFQTFVQKIMIAFKTLKLDTIYLLELKRQKSFPTRELNIIKKELEDEKKRNTEPIPFCVLPPKSFHDQITREHEVQDISKKMKELSNRKMGETKTVYLSGNPGCGKSVLAGQIGDEYFDSDDTVQPAFVMTINAATMDTLLQSYIDFAARLNCYPDSITEITTSKDLSQEKQILQLKALTAKQVDKYASWLMIVDNVTNLKTYSKFWPQFGEKTSGVGQILVTTQDEHCIPDNFHTQHVSLKRGMSEGDAIEVLSNVSGIREDDERMLEVAKSLDLQPLALACAGVYMKKATSTTWQQFLEKLDQGKREATEKMFQESSLNYPMSMTLAVQMALERETSGSKVMFHAFEFLSVLANDPIPMKNVVEYVMKCLPQEDEEVVESTVASSSLLMTSDDGGELLTHQIVYHCLQDHDQVKGKNVDIFSATETFSYVLKFFNKNAVKDIVKSRGFLNHFERFSRLLPLYIVQQQSKCQSYLNEHGETFIKILNTIGSICSVHGKFKTAKMFFQLSLSMQLPFFVKEMENLFVESDIVKFNDVRKGLDMILEKAMSIFKNKNVSCDQPDLTLLSCHHESLNETEKRNIAETLSSLGIALSNLGEFSEARDCHKVALNICELECSNLGEFYEARSCLKSVRDICEVHCSNLGEFYKVRDCLKGALEICELEYAFNLLWLKLKAAILDNLVEISKEMQVKKDVQQYGQYCLFINEKIRKFALSSRKSTCFYNEGHGLFYNEGRGLNANVYIKASSYYGLGKSLYSLAAHSEDRYSAKCVKGAITHFKKALKRYESVYHDRNHPKVAHTLNQLGRCAFRLEKYDEAKSYHEEALSIYKSIYTEDHPMVGSTLSNLDIAEVLRDLHEYTEARMCYEDALAIGNSKDYPCITESLLDLGDSCYEEEMYSEALRCYEIALAAGDHLPYTSLDKISTAFHVQRQPHEAKSLYNKALTTGYGKDCPLVVKEIFNLGTVLRRHGKLNKAKSWYDKAFATGYGKDCPSVGEEIFHLGTLLRHQGQLNEAKSCYDNALTTGYGKDCPLPGRSIFELGTALHHQGQLNDAKSCYDNARTTGYGKDCPSVGEAIFKLGTSVRNQGQLNDAKSCYENALTTGYGKDCPSVGEEIFQLGTALRYQGQLNGAKSWYDKALATGYGKDCPSVGEEIFKLGTALRNQGQLNEAKSCYDSALTTGYGKDCPPVGEEIFKLGTALRNQGQLNEAKSCYDSALTTGYGKDCPPVGEEIFKLGTALRNQGQL